MLSRQLIGGSLAAFFGAGALIVSAAAPQAAMLVVKPHAAFVHPVDCAIGAHIGPLGACIVGDGQPTVIERRAADDPGVTREKTITHHADGCTTKSVTEGDGMGNSETRTKSNCD